MDKILITGANSRLGKHLVNIFEEKGHAVMSHNGKAHFNLEYPNDVYNLGLNAKEFGVNVIINNAAITCPGKTLSELTSTDITRMIAVNLTAPILLINQLSSCLTHVININSMVGLEIKANRTIYSASKWGLRGFSQSFKKENHKITTLDVYPTKIKIDSSDEYGLDVYDVVQKIYTAYESKSESLVLDGRENIKY